MAQRNERMAIRRKTLILVGLAVTAVVAAAVATWWIIDDRSKVHMEQVLIADYIHAERISRASPGLGRRCTIVVQWVKKPVGEPQTQTIDSSPIAKSLTEANGQRRFIELPTSEEQVSLQKFEAPFGGSINRTTIAATWGLVGGIPVIRIFTTGDETGGSPGTVDPSPVLLSGVPYMAGCGAMTWHGDETQHVEMVKGRVQVDEITFFDDKMEDGCTVAIFACFED